MRQQVKVYFTPDEYTALVAKAGGLSLSSYVRDVVTAELRRHPPKASEAPIDALRGEIRKIIREELSDALPSTGRAAERTGGGCLK